MKFGRLIYKYTGKTYVDTSAIYNIGDNFQTYAIDNIYEKMGIPKEDIIDINACEMKNYSGDYVIVLMAGYASHYKRFNQLPPSEKIIPLFFSFEMSDETCDDIVPYLRQHMPIGCRDEATMKLLRKKGVEAYVSGCLTITLPKRETEPEKQKVFLVDIPSELEKHIPPEIRKNCEYIKHEGTVAHAPMTDEDRIKIDEYAKEIYLRYKTEASLVITSRLHAAAPCIALGIPVILAIDNIDLRFSWLDKLIPIYNSEHYGEINWSPQALEIEDLKQDITSLVIEKLRKVWKDKRGIYDLSAYWENRNRAEYNHKLYLRLKDLREKYNKEDFFEYIIWGAGVHGRLAYSMVSELFPNAKLVAIVDKYMDGEMFGCKIVRSDAIKEMKFDYALITTHLGRHEAVEALSEMNKQVGKDWGYFISKDIPEEFAGGN